MVSSGFKRNYGPPHSTHISPINEPNKSTLPSDLVQDPQYRNILADKITGLLNLLPPEAADYFNIDFFNNLKGSLLEFRGHIEDLQENEQNDETSSDDFSLSSNLLIPPIPRLKLGLNGRQGLASLKHSKVNKDSRRRSSRNKYTRIDINETSDPPNSFSNSSDSLSLLKMNLGQNATEDLGNTEKIHSILAYYDCYKIQLKNSSQLLTFLSSSDSRFPTVIATQLRDMVIRIESQLVQFSGILQQHSWLRDCLLPLIQQGNAFLSEIMDFERSNIQANSLTQIPTSYKQFSMHSLHLTPDSHKVPQYQNVTPTQTTPPNNVDKPIVSPTSPNILPNIMTKTIPVSQFKLDQDLERGEIHDASSNIVTEKLDVKPIVHYAPLTRSQRVLRNSTIVKEQVNSPCPDFNTAIADIEPIGPMTQNIKPPAVIPTGSKVLKSKTSKSLEPSSENSILIQADVEISEDDLDLTEELMLRTRSSSHIIQESELNINGDANGLKATVMDENEASDDDDIWNDINSREEFFAPDDELDQDWKPAKVRNKAKYTKTIQNQESTSESNNVDSKVRIHDTPKNKKQSDRARETPKSKEQSEEVHVIYEEPSNPIPSRPKIKKKALKTENHPTKRISLYPSKRKTATKTGIQDEKESLPVSFALSSHPEFLEEFVPTEQSSEAYPKLEAPHNTGKTFTSKTPGSIARANSKSLTKRKVTPDLWNDPIFLASQEALKTEATFERARNPGSRKSSSNLIRENNKYEELEKNEYEEFEKYPVKHQTDLNSELKSANKISHGDFARNARNNRDSRSNSDGSSPEWWKIV